MCVPVEDARQLVTAWAELQTDLPTGWKMSQGTTDKDSSWNFKIGYEHPVSKMKFYLVCLKVADSGDLVVYNDRRERIGDLLSHPEGFLHETRFFDALSVRTKETPSWFLEVERANSFIDKRGVDGFAKVKIEDTTKLKVPFQIKSSKGGVWWFFEKHPSYRGVVLPIVVNEERTENQIRQNLYSAAGEVRRNILKGVYTTVQFKERITETIRSRRVVP